MKPINIKSFSNRIFIVYHSKYLTETSHKGKWSWRPSPYWSILDKEKGYVGAIHNTNEALPPEYDVYDLTYVPLSLGELTMYKSN